jgi:hypothetical protein
MTLVSLNKLGKLRLYRAMHSNNTAIPTISPAGVDPLVVVAMCVEALAM